MLSQRPVQTQRHCDLQRLRTLCACAGALKHLLHLTGTSLPRHPHTGTSHPRRPTAPRHQAQARPHLPEAAPLPLPALSPPPRLHRLNRPARSRPAPLHHPRPRPAVHPSTAAPRILGRVTPHLPAPRHLHPHLRRRHRHQATPADRAPMTTQVRCRHMKSTSLDKCDLRSSFHSTLNVIGSRRLLTLRIAAAALP